MKKLLIGVLFSSIFVLSFVSAVECGDNITEDTILDHDLIDCPGIGLTVYSSVILDYVWLGDLSSAKRVMEQLPAWFEDYNNHAPHKGLNMMAPRRYIQLRRAAA